ncbi:MAG: hypothetical protein JSU07_09895 [Bacteroidetes bacterium]|nr:hypothetical protein [Bacteroidota bacterium]
MKNKKWMLLLIIAFPPILWVTLESGTINSKKLPIYGEKKLKENGDTLYQTVSDTFIIGGKTQDISKKDFPFYAIMFIKNNYQNDGYRILGLLEYLKYKKEKIENVPFYLITENNSNFQLADSLKVIFKQSDVKILTVEKNDFQKINYTYFMKKPIYVDYSFFVLIDQNRNIRGYYDGRYVSEFKRLIDEYKHLVLKEAKKQLTKENEIERK